MQLSDLTTAASALSKLILVSPEKDNLYTPQIDGADSFLFHYEGENSVMLESDIPDHYLEDNRSVQDQVALKPEIVSVQGFIGELNDIAPPLLQPIKRIAQKLTLLDAFVPELSATALLAYNEAFFFYQTGAQLVNSAVGAWNSITGNATETKESGSVVKLLTQTKAQQAFAQFYGYWQNRTLFTVQTPWAIFRNMAIKSIKTMQDAETRVITDFELSFKAMRFASTIGVETVAVGVDFDTRAGYQAAPELNSGNVSATEAPDSLGTQLGRVA